MLGINVDVVEDEDVVEQFPLSLPLAPFVSFRRSPLFPSRASLLLLLFSILLVLLKSDVLLIPFPFLAIWVAFNFHFFWFLGLNLEVLAFLGRQVGKDMDCSLLEIRA